MRLTIAIDGPVASGKTAVGRALARRLAARFLDTGTMYRAVTWAAIDGGVDLADEAVVTELAEGLDIRLTLDEGELVMTVGGDDVTDLLRTPEVEAAVSSISAVAGVRRAMVAQQRRVARDGSGDIVMVGRDIGTVVLPDASIKVFLDASVRVRARRRHDELRRKGNLTDLDLLAAEIELRDKIDSEREDSPLRPAIDGVRVDTDNLRIDQVVGLVLELVNSL